VQVHAVKLRLRHRLLSVIRERSTKQGCLYSICEEKTLYFVKDDRSPFSLSVITQKILRIQISTKFNLICREEGLDECKHCL
jgi:hypothetical protein